MLAFVRKAARSWVAAILIGLLVISFAVWGISDVFTGGNKNNVATIGHDAISAQEFKSEFERLIKRASKETGRTITQKEARDAGQDTAIIESMVSERAFLSFMNILGLKISDEKVKAEIQKIPAFTDPTTNKFSQMAYENLLNENGMNLQKFEDSVRSDMGRQLLIVAATSGIRAPKQVASQTLAFATERRFISMVPVPASIAGAPKNPNDAQLNQYYNEIKAQLMRPESRDLTLIIADLQSYMGKVTPDPIQAKQLFESQKSKLIQPAKRSFVQIVAPTKEKADIAAARLKAGEDAQAIASSLGLQNPLTFNDATITQVPDKKIGEVIFANQTGAIGAVQGALSFSAYKITNSIAQIDPKFEDIAPQINIQLKTELAGQALTDATNVYDDMISQGESVEAAAQKAGFKIIKIANVTQDGKDIKNNQEIAQLKGFGQVLSDAFSIAKGDATDLSTAPNDTYVAIKVDNIVPKAPVPLAEVKNEIANAWIQRDLSSKIKAKAEQIVADAKSMGLEKAVQKAGLKIIKAPQPLMRGQGSPQLSELIFSAKNGEIVTGPVANGVEYAIIRVEKILKDDETKANDRLVQAEEQVRGTFQKDIVTLMNDMVRKKAKAKIYPDRIKFAFGDNEEDVTTKQNTTK